MATDKCPECGASVKADNLKRHLRNVHPGVDPDTVLTQEQRETARRAQRASAGRPLRRSPVVWGGLVVLLVAGAVVGMPYLLNLTSGSGLNIVTSCGLEGTVEHYHPLLVINDNGVQQFLPWDQSQPGDIGYINTPAYTNPAHYCPSGEYHVLHTHDGSGIIHVELPQTVAGQPTLGEFFQIWGQPLGTGVVWTFSGPVTATMYNGDTGRITDYSGNPGGIPLYPPAAGPTANPYPIPPALIGSGHGDGASNGVFSGEIIWLNVTA